MAPTKTLDLSRVQLIASDLDGTLIVGGFNAGKISPRTVSALHAIENKGLRIIFASGRPTRTMIHAVDQAEGLSHLLCICCNGAQILDSHTRTIIKKFSIPPDHVRAIIKQVKNALGPHVLMAAESDVHYKSDSGFHEQCGKVMQGKPVLVDQDPIEGFLTKPDSEEQDTVENLLLTHRTWPASQLYEFLRTQVFADPKWEQIIHLTFSSSHFVEICAAGVSKASALAYLCNKLDVDPNNLIAFGDMPNDIEMLKFAGIAVAMGNAHENVKAIADLTTETNEDDGVAVVLEKIVQL
ncbi:hypothetical protein K492DRAFT_203566 [Lichtheimia hyalospora FSU 10163]|nr:hypothetical protein K492DRAFT_203566 [Lichtheimia hyalospora FSU 10163]